MSAARRRRGRARGRCNAEGSFNECFVAAARTRAALRDATGASAVMASMASTTRSRSCVANARARVMAPSTRRRGTRVRAGDAREAATRGARDARPSPGSSFDVIVLGNGPIGSAVARHVCAFGSHRVLVLDSERLTSGSDDLGRIVRPLDAEGRDEWTDVNVRSIEAFEEMEQRSGTTFFTKRGSLAIGSETFVERGASRLRARDVAHRRAKTADDAFGERFTFFTRKDVPEGYEAVWDDVGGYVNPHSMREAQNALMREASEGNAMVVRATGERVESGGANGDKCTVTIDDGSAYTCDVCVMACGYYTEPLARECGLIDDGDEDAARFGEVRIARRTVLLAEVLESEVTGALAGMPTIKYEVPRAILDAARVRRVSKGAGSDHSANEAKSVYVLPPIYYPGPVPSAGWYVKIGGGPLDYFDKTDASWIKTERELAEWMSSDGDEIVADQLHDILFHMFPGINFQSLSSKACAYATSSDGSLQVRTLGVGRDVIAVAGCQGKGAGPADAIGVDVARVVIDRLAARAPP